MTTNYQFANSYTIIIFDQCVFLVKVYQKSWSYAILFLRYGTWWMQLLFFILGYFLPFYPLTAPKIKFSKKLNKKKKKKKVGDIIILHKCTKNHDYMLCCSWDMACNKCNCHFSSWAIFLPFYLPNNPKNENFKNIKKHLEISSFYTSVPKIMFICVTVPEILLVMNAIVIFHFPQFFALLSC